MIGLVYSAWLITFDYSSFPQTRDIMLRRVVIDQVLTVDAVGIPSNDLLGQELLLVMIFLIGPGLATLVLTSDPLCSFL